MDYNSKKWKKKRAHILRLDGYKDRIELMYGRTKEATIVHHIFPAETWPEYAYEDWNLISVSLATHNKLENRTTRELTALGYKLQDFVKRNRNWRNSPPMF